MRKTITVLKLLWFPEWRLLPWYSHDVCRAGCCSHHVFTWLFLRVHIILEK